MGRGRAAAEEQARGRDPAGGLCGSGGEPGTSADVSNRRPHACRRPPRAPAARHKEHTAGKTRSYAKFKNKRHSSDCGKRVEIC